MDIYAGPNNGVKSGTHYWGQPMNCRLDRVYKSAETLLVADCGTRPYNVASNQGTSFGLNENSCLYYTTDTAGEMPVPFPGVTTDGPGPGGRMYNIAYAIKTYSWLGNRIPLAKAPNNPSQSDRHQGGVMNIGFCDGHVEALGIGDFIKVRVSPWRY
jgi:prepilin-type processing-associated H-X9-DG protein